jgi:hypothetical protein
VLNDASAAANKSKKSFLMEQEYSDRETQTIEISEGFEVYQMVDGNNFARRRKDPLTWQI